MPPADHPRRPLVAAAIAFLIAAALAGLLIQRIEAARVQAERVRVMDLAAVRTHALQAHIGQALSATHALAALVQQGDGTVRDFEHTAQRLLDAFPGAATLALAPAGVIRAIAPLAGNAAALGLDLLHDPLEGAEATRARDTGALTLAGPFPLVQGGLGAVGQLPVFLADGSGAPAFWGFITSLLRFPATLADARLAELTDFGLAYVLWRQHPVSGERQVIAASDPDAPGVLGDDPVDHTLEVPNGTWTLSVAPRAGWGDGPGLPIEGALGLAFSLLLAVLVKLLLEARAQRRGLAALVAQRTAELRASAADLSHAQAVAEVGSWVFVPRTGAFQWSAEARRILGLAADGGFAARAFLHRVARPERRALVRFWRAARAGQAAEVELRLAPPDPSGQPRWVHVRTEGERNGADSGPGGRGIATVQDITARKTAQEALRVALVKYKTLFDCAPLGITVCDPTGQVLEINATAATVLGLSSPAELAERRIDWLGPRLIRPDGTPRPAAEYATLRAIREGRVIRDLESGLVLADGHTLWLSATAAPLPGYGVVSILSDITERKRMEQALALSEARYRQIVETANEGIWVIDRQRITTFVNARMAELLDCTRADLIGHSCFAFIDPADHDLARTLMAENEAGARSQQEFRFFRRDGSALWTFMSTTALPDADGQVTHLLAMVTDITARKQAEEEVKQLAFYDPLTGLANRRLLQDRLTRAGIASTRSGQLGALLFLDLDDFKALNDTYGHDAGDAVLKQAAQRMTGTVRAADSVARLGGDEFVIMLEDLGEQPAAAADTARLVAAKVLAALDQPYRLDGQACHCTTSIGIALFNHDDRQRDPDGVLKRADLALYQAKGAGRNGWVLFDPAPPAAAAKTGDETAAR